MSESDERRDDERDAGALAGEEPEWNTPEDEPPPTAEADLPVAVRRVLATDQHLSQRRVFYGQAGADEEEPEAEDEDEAPR